MIEYFFAYLATATVVASRGYSDIYSICWMVLGSGYIICSLLRYIGHALNMRDELDSVILIYSERRSKFTPQQLALHTSAINFFDNRMKCLQEYRWFWLSSPISHDLLNKSRTYLERTSLQIEGWTRTAL